MTNIQQTDQIPRHKMRIVMFPAVGVRDENRYIDIIVKAIREKGVKVISWNKHFSLQKGDIFHIHWPEIITEIRTRKYNAIRGMWIYFQFFSTIKRIKKCGGHIVWTVHDIYPHDKKLYENIFYHHFMKRFIDKVDIAISLTSAGIDQIQEAIPLLQTRPFHVVHHPHYRDVLNVQPYDMKKRHSSGITDNQCVYSFIGTLRPNKCPDLVVKAFIKLPINSNLLIMSGSASRELEDEILRLSNENKNIRLDFKKVPEAKISDLYAISDIFVFPGTAYLNSGTIYTSLSFNVPVIAGWSETNQEIQQIVGTEWLYLYQGAFSSYFLEEASRRLIKRRGNPQCDLSRFSPNIVAEQHLNAYTSIFKGRIRKINES